MNANEQLRRWMLARLDENPPPGGFPNGPDSVTALAYHFWTADQLDARFRFVEVAFRETWRHCGMLKSVVVCNAPCHAAEDFAVRFSPWVEVQVEPSLVPGAIDSMSVDCDSRLAKRFSTANVLVVQEDGFPLRRGLEPFLGKWDFIGAPYVRDRLPQRLFCRIFGCWVSNGGFSLRSHEICERAAWFWKRKYSRLSGHWRTEDLYYTQFLPLHERTYRHEMRIADNRTAMGFSCDAIVPFDVPILPFGFHRAETFVKLHTMMGGGGGVTK